MTEREWQRLQKSMQFVIEQQVKFEVNFARIEANFDKANDHFIPIGEPPGSVGAPRRADDEGGRPALQAQRSTFGSNGGKP
jgi:hypothetical protein